MPNDEYAISNAESLVSTNKILQANRKTSNSTYDELAEKLHLEFMALAKIYGASPTF